MGLGICQVDVIEGCEIPRALCMIVEPGAGDKVADMKNSSGRHKWDPGFIILTINSVWLEVVRVSYTVYGRMSCDRQWRFSSVIGEDYNEYCGFFMSCW